MKYAFFVWSGEVNNNDFFHKCLKSLQNVSDCKIVVYTPNLKRGTDLLNSMDVKVVKFSEDEWKDRRIICKVEKVREFLNSLEGGDKLMIFDGDMFMVSDPFKVFENEFDYFYTSRDHPKLPANAGCWGFRCNQNSKEFLDIFIENLKTPTWEPYIELRENHPFASGVDYNGDWWVEQDFMSCIHNYKDEINDGLLGIELKIHDAKNKYNYIITGKTDEEIFSGIENGDISVLHFKSSNMNRWINGSVGDRMESRLDRLTEMINKFNKNKV